MTYITIHLGSQTPHYYDIVRIHRSQAAAERYAARQNAATLRRYPTAMATYEAAAVDADGHVYAMDGRPNIAPDGYHRIAR